MIKAGNMKEKLQRMLVVAAITGSLFVGVSFCIGTVPVDASESSYDSIEQTIDRNVAAITEEIAEIYPICPELLQAMVFYESSNKPDVVSEYGDTGYMQVNPRWHRNRMEKLGVTDLTDGYSNILVGTDYLVELCEEYGDMAMALMAYNMGTDKAEELAETGVISGYAEKILELSEKLERRNGK